MSGRPEAPHLSPDLAALLRDVAAVTDSLSVSAPPAPARVSEGGTVLGHMVPGDHDPGQIATFAKTHQKLRAGTEIDTGDIFTTYAEVGHEVGAEARRAAGANDPSRPRGISDTQELEAVPRTILDDVEDSRPVSKPSVRPPAIGATSIMAATLIVRPSPLLDTRNSVPISPGSPDQATYPTSESQADTSEPDPSIDDDVEPAPPENRAPRAEDDPGAPPVDEVVTGQHHIRSHRHNKNRHPIRKIVQAMLGAAAIYGGTTLIMEGINQLHRH